MPFDLIIANGTIATSADTFVCDIGIRDGRIAALGHDLGPAPETIDASGRLVLPGGIDSHVHIAQPSGEGIVMADDFESATRSAAFGGNTTVMPFLMQEKGAPLRATLAAYHAKAEGRCHIDVAFHLVISEPTAQVLGQDLPALIEDGYTSFKVFMTYEGLALSDLEMLQVMSVARETGALVMVHAENHDAIRFLTDKLEREGRRAPHFHGTSRPIPVEREATHRAISLAELVDVPLMIVHVSNAQAMEEIARGRARGLKIYGETCPQYLVLTERDMDGLNMEGPGTDDGMDGGMDGAKYVCSPPPRDLASQKACWDGLANGTFQVFSSDHCPFRYDDPQGKLNPKGEDVVPLGSQRHSRHRDAAAHPVFGGRRQGPHHAQSIRRADGDQSRPHVRADEQGLDRHRHGCRYRHLGPGQAGDDQPVGPASRIGLHALRGAAGHRLADHDHCPRTGRRSGRRTGRCRHEGRACREGQIRLRIDGPMLTIEQPMPRQQAISCRRCGLRRRPGQDGCS